MLKQVVEYTDFDGNKQRDELWFHLSKSSLMMTEQEVYDEIIELGDQLKANLPSIEKAEKNIEDVSNKDTQVFVDVARIMAKMLDKIVDLGYGIRQGSNKFVRNQEILQEFKSSLAYDEFVVGLLSDPDKLLEFVQTLTGQIK